jgi:hypothetical protein
MEPVFAIECDLLHDGDGVVRYSFELSNGSFAARTLAWGSETQHLELAEALAGFPSSFPSEVSYRFGTPGTGVCELQFFCIDGSGHLGLWARFESEYPSGWRTQYEHHERASLFTKCDPAGIDAFVARLRGFVAGSTNRAELAWLGP